MVMRLERSVLSELAQSFGMAVVALTALLLIEMVYQVVLQGLPLASLVKFIPLMVPYALPWTIPAAFVAACIMTYSRMAGSNELTVVRVEDLEALELAEYDAVILANVYRLGAGGLRRIESYVRGGGGLIVFLGDQVDVEYYRAHLYAGGRGLLPRPVGDVVRPPAGAAPFALGDWDVDHPVMRAFIGELASVLRAVQVSAFTDSALAVEGAAASEDGEGVAVFARFDDAAHSPALLERRYGRGHCVLVTTSCDQEWNDWAGSFSYVPMMLELVQYAARRSGAGLTAVVGAPLVCSMESGSSAHSARVETPDYPVEPAYVVEIETGDDGACLLPIRATGKTGVYRIELTGAGGEAAVRYAAVNADAAESNLAGAGRVKLEDALVGVPFEYVRDLSVFEDEASSGRHELWWPLLLAAIIVLMFEQVMAWWFGRRGRKPKCGKPKCGKPKAESRNAESRKSKVETLKCRNVESRNLKSGVKG